MRLFVAVEVPGAVRDAVGEAVVPLRAASPGWRWVAPQRYHLTIVFLGDVPEAAVAPIAGALDTAAAGVARFDVALNGRLGTFGRRVLWAGLESSPRLRALADAVARELRPVVALPDADREFSAHLTLARAGRQPVRRERVEDVAAPVLRWAVERVVLMRSAGGYRVEHAAALADAGA